MSFEPLIGKIYHLYEREDGSDLLSLIAPNEWGRSKPFSKEEMSTRNEGYRYMLSFEVFIG